MSNKASNNLHELIKSLTKAEKRYFKVYASRHMSNSSSNYERLFDAIDRQTDYNEDLLLKKFKGEPLTKRFSIAKNRLYQSVLRSLDAFHANSSTEAQLKRQIHSAEILYHKNLDGQALKILRSARKVAEKHEKITSLIEIGKWEKRILEKKQYEGQGKKDLKKLLEEDQMLTARLDTYNQLWNIKSRIFRNLYQKGKARSGKDLSKFKKILDELAVKQEQEGMLTENTFLLNHLYSAYYFGIGEDEGSYPYLKANLSLIERQPHLFDEEPTRLMTTLTNLIYVGHKLGHEKEAFENLEKLRSLPAQEGGSDVYMEVRVFALSSSIELALHIASGSYEEGFALVQRIEEGLYKYEGYLSSVRKASFYFNIAVLYLKASRLNESLKWINQLLNNIEIDKTQDIHCMGQILNLIIHLELENKSLIPYALRSTQRFLETRERVYRFESVILKFINEILKERRNSTEQELYEQLAIDLNALSDDPFERQVFEYFDFREWANLQVQHYKNS
ncbi:MAG: hypothetical protein MK081_11640 [Flavobacteriales bacterium]|nr:hypothetical protein [Flavobacteriales bacterium]